MDGIAVVTGGASGIGAACCRELAASGARVVVADRDLTRALAVAKEIGGRAFAIDVADEESARNCAAKIEAELGPVEALVNSAGIIQTPVRPTELSMSLYDDIIRVDQRGTYVACVAFGRLMLPRRRGAIVNIASVAGMRSMPLHAYGPAKAAVIAMTECLAAEWGPAQVRVNCVSPGYTRPPALHASIDKGERDPSALASNSALGRLVEPAEIARVVSFLVSPAASAMTGVNVPVDCGWLVAPSWRTYGGLRAPESN
jgi:NAD(P)-dependent dehydrogenase (short-subunit alcohol dehydrogenase family)